MAAKDEAWFGKAFRAHISYLVTLVLHLAHRRLNSDDAVAVADVVAVDINYDRRTFAVDDDVVAAVVVEDAVVAVDIVELPPDVSDAELEAYRSLCKC